MMGTIHAETHRFPFRNLDRLAQILRVVARKGWSHYVERLQLGHLVPTAVATATPAVETDAQRLRSGREELGPTFVKFGQLLKRAARPFPG